MLVLPNRGLAILGDIIKWDDWNGSLKTVQDAEATVRKDSMVYNTMQIKEDLGELVEIARRKEMKLREFYSSLQRYSLQQMEREDNREDNRCLKDLRSPNPNDDMICIERTKGGLLYDSYV